MFIVSKEFRFEAAHHLTLVPKDHKCRNTHGHSYRFEVVFESPELDHRGFVVDYAEIAEAVAPVLNACDHSDLNAWMECETTAENIAEWIFHTVKRWFVQTPAGTIALTNKRKDQASLLTEVRVYETPTTCAIYRHRESA